MNIAYVGVIIALLGMIAGAAITLIGLGVKWGGLTGDVSGLKEWRIGAMATMKSVEIACEKISASFETFSCDHREIKDRLKDLLTKAEHQETLNRITRIEGQLDHLSEEVAIHQRWHTEHAK